MDARNPQAAALFRAHFKNHPNVFTPHVKAYRMVAGGRLAVELSWGEIERYRRPAELWGVTVLLADNPRSDVSHALSECFQSREEAERYIENLRQWRPLTAEGEKA